MNNHGHLCSFKCFGKENYDGSCCHVEDRNWIMGPIEDYEKFLVNMSEKLGRTVGFEEVFHDFEEGSKLFPDKPVWQERFNYPAFKVDLEKERKPCVLYNSATRSCSVYEIRPETCRNYLCDFLHRELLFR
jgi:Fe-S-cluster containining protein